MKRILRVFSLTSALAALAFTAAPTAAQGPQAPGAPVVHGSGTINVVPRWTSSTTIGDSALSQILGNLTTAGNMSVGGTLSAATVNSSHPYQIGGGNVLSIAGTDNLFVGLGAGSSNAGFENTASGARALEFNTTGSDNTASGVDALFQNTTGNNNTA